MTMILVVDDDEDFRAYLSTLLSRLGYQPVAARSGAEAMRMLDRHPVALAVCDVVMPDMDGIELLRAMRDRFPALKVLMISGGLTGITGPIANVTAILGAEAMMTKPLDAKAFSAAVSRALEVSEA